MTPKESQLFKYLCEKSCNKPLPSQRLIALAFGVHQTYISQLISRLEKKGYITKKSVALATRANGKGK